MLCRVALLKASIPSGIRKEASVNAVLRRFRVAPCCAVLNTARRVNRARCVRRGAHYGVVADGVLATFAVSGVVLMAVWCPARCLRWVRGARSGEVLGVMPAAAWCRVGRP